MRKEKLYLYKAIQI